MKRVVVTGFGTVNPMGKNVKDTWNNVISGKSGIGPITKFDASHLPTRIAGEIKDFDYKEYYDEADVKAAKRMDLFCHYAVAAMKEAAADSGINTKENPNRIGVLLGSGIGGLNVYYANSVALHEKGARRISPFYIPLSIGNIASGYVAKLYGIKGPNLSMQTACATSNHSIAVAALLIKSGMADAMFAGGTEGVINELAVGGFSNMRAISTRNDEPEKASRPFDKDRDGFVMAEGSAVLVLEEYEYAKKRGANILCEIAGSGMSGDAYDLVAPDPEGRGALLSMEMALEQAGVSSDQVDYINTHGTSTPVGDIAETKAIAKLLKGKEDNVTVGSTKSYHGHLLGATAALEAIITIKAMQNGKIPANLNLENQDPEIPLTCINKDVVEKEINVALSNSFGFGGHNSTVVFKKM